MIINIKIVCHCIKLMYSFYNFQAKATGQTVFEVRTKASRLPIVDFMPQDYGKSNQKFGFKLGQVCFL